MRLSVVCSVLLSFVILNAKANSNPPANGMVKIPAGKYTSFLADKTAKQVAVKSFYLDVKAVTNAEFLEFVKSNPRWARSKVTALYAESGYLKHWASDFSIGSNYEKVKNSPVTNISWYAATAYAKWKGKRLPSLNEWEYAANAPLVNSQRTVEQTILKWYSKPTPIILPPTGSASKNKFSVFDMHGLIWEWVYDFNSVIMNDDSRSNSVNQSLFCATGAASTIDKENYAAFMRFAFRGSLKAKYTTSNLGFRCAADVKN
ncbi:MAG: hypothetical protein K0S09_3028 [Sphingobacteriaceae bacterium]|nr:hypothetical protein [Sphingobacteriaceae bacterium]